ncbi:MATE family efflux transporter [Lactonifactor sp. BIOML-A3]|uniref:MATE family efflux transporter n=1 Tax=unclassified Lactonifactor TaxID=2636670 RepID=UPI0012AF2A7A|nr:MULTISPECIES: MATE family efflux transporter [unclassified Lactonifactor]MSA02014.1 MATE family efflux transporter [Lactonifactor sp. BIOML-A5]MSA08528.1 MATE family efflux transporter [Lactonifactor sp. BIOML-A4]MSA12903.1 MATE family efflux transporter [Lactonifactor sp. BIOML-A3]MSA17595.1 MATE family efflux transporter [Lactonifactor sp. BIOML-A2]MSA37127.1 MATE family efflux transporter [Lactonifactor sp. BIOML-A1]
MSAKIQNRSNAVFYRKLFSLVLPIAFQQFMLAAVSASDALMLGVISQDALSAVSLAGQITFVFNLFMGGLTMGTSILAAQYYGKGDKESIEKIFGYVTRISFLISIVFFCASLFAPSMLMRIFTSETQLISGGINYLRIVSASYLFTGISQIYLCILKNTDYAMKSMVIGSSAVVINLFLNATLIYGLWFFPELGLGGAALATSISKLIEMAWVYAESLRKNRIRLHIKYCITVEQWLVRDYWKYTLPMLGDYLVWGVGFSMYSVVMGHLGSDAVAANSIANIAKNLIVSFCTGLGNGGGIIVGNALGTGNLEQAKRYGGLLWKLSIASGMVSGLLLIALSPLILNVTVLTSQASEYLQWMLILCACYMVAKAINTTTIAGIFPSGGDSKFGLICDTITMWLFAVPAGFLAAFVFHLPVVIVFLIVNLDEVVKVPAAIIHYKKYGWLQNITRE